MAEEFTRILGGQTYITRGGVLKTKVLWFFTRKAPEVRKCLNDHPCVLARVFLGPDKGCAGFLKVGAKMVGATVP